MFKKILKNIEDTKLFEEISNKGTPTRDAMDKSAISLYRKAYYDYREHKSEKNKYYLRGIQDALISSLGESKFGIMKERIKKEYTKNRIV